MERFKIASGQTVRTRWPLALELHVACEPTRGTHIKATRASPSGSIAQHALRIGGVRKLCLFVGLSKISGVDPFGQMESRIHTPNLPNPSSFAHISIWYLGKILGQDHKGLKKSKVW